MCNIFFFRKMNIYPIIKKNNIGYNIRHTIVVKEPDSI